MLKTFSSPVFDVFLSMSVSLLRIVALLFLLAEANAQTQLEGSVFELGSSLPIGNVRVSNVTTGKFTFSDTAGVFKLPAKKGDIIALNLFSYEPDTAFLIELKRDFFLQPVSNALKEVVVEGVKISLGSLVDRTPQGVTYQKNPDGTTKGGMVFRLSYWNKDSAKERRSQRKLGDFEVLEEIDRVFSNEFISKNTPLKDEELINFRNLYRPPLKEYKSPGFNLILYLNDCYKEFKTLPPDKRRLPPLVPFNPK